ncbi:hypothetical protein J3F84DRAFT_341183 [Trichoderma pleuroticola]
MGYAAEGGGTSRTQQGTVTPRHWNLALAWPTLASIPHIVMVESRLLGAIGEQRGGALDLIQVQALAAACELWPSHVAPAKPPSHLASPASLHARVSYSTNGWGQDSTSTNYGAVCARVRVGACTATRQGTSKQAGWRALYGRASMYVAWRLNLVQVAGPPLPYWLPIQEREQHQADSPFHTRRLPKAQSRCCTAIDGDTGHTGAG